jgi:hypothetical protein
MRSAEDWFTWWDAFDLLSWCADEDNDLRISQRKLRLFAVASCRTIWPFLTEDISRRAVEVAEWSADHPDSLEALRTVRKMAEEARRAAEPEALVAAAPREEVVAYYCAALAECLTQDDFYYQHMAQDVADTVIALVIHSAIPPHLRGTGEGDAIAEQAIGGRRSLECDLVREIFCNPLRPVSITPAWRTPQALAIARTAYEERRWEDLPLLADALEEAGCTDVAILSHLRGPGPHVRGCWPVDLILGLE